MNQRYIIIEEYIFTIQKYIEDIIDSKELKKYDDKNISKNETKEHKKKRLDNINNEIQEYEKLKNCIISINNLVNEAIEISKIYRNLNTSVYVLEKIYNKDIENNNDSLSSRIKSIFHKSIDPITTNKLNNILKKFDKITKSLFIIYNNRMKNDLNIKTMLEEIRNFLDKDTIRKTFDFALSVDIEERMTSSNTTKEYKEQLNEYKIYYRNIDNQIYDYEKLINKMSKIDKRIKLITITEEYVNNLSTNEKEKMKLFTDFLNNLKNEEKAKINKIKNDIMNQGFDRVIEKVSKKKREEIKNNYINILAELYEIKMQTQDIDRKKEIDLEIEMIINNKELTDEDIKKAFKIVNNKNNKDIRLSPKKSYEQTEQEKETFIKQYIANKMSKEKFHFTSQSEEENDTLLKEWEKEALEEWKKNNIKQNKININNNN